MKYQILFFSLFFSFFVSSQTKIETRLLGIDDGLPSNKVYDVYQDNKGIIWLGTDNGLCRYVGNQIEKMDYAALGMEAKVIFDIIQDNSNNFILATSKGFEVFDSKFRENKAIEAVLNSPLESRSIIIRKLLKKDEEIWAVTNTEQLLKFSELPSLHLVSKETKLIIDMNKDDYGNIWLSDSKSIQQYKGNDFEIKKIDAKDFSYHATVFCHYFDKEFCAFYGKNDVLFSKGANLEKNEKTPLNYQFKEIINQIHLKLKLKTNKSLYQIGISLYCCFRDNINNLWIGTDRGLFVVSKNEIFISDIDAFSTYSLRAIFEDKIKQKLLFSSYSGGLCIDKKNKKVTKIPKWDFVRKYIDYKDQYLVGVGDANSFRVLNKENYSVTLSELLPFTINSIARKNNLILISTEQGIKQISNVAKSKVINFENINDNNKLLNKNYQTLYEDPNHSIVWAGGYAALSRIDLEKKVTVAISAFSNPNVNNIYTFYTDKKDHLWVGTKDNGLFEIDKLSGEVIRRLSTNNGLTSNTINTILPYNDNEILLSTDNSICKVNMLTYEVINFSKIDGLTLFEFNSCSAFMSSDSVYYFGGVNGVNYFHKNKLKSYKYGLKPKLIVYKIMKNNIDLLNTNNESFYFDNKNEIVFNAEDKGLDIFLSSSDLSNPQTNKYEYQIQGFDNQWISNNTNPIIRIYNLPPNKYKLLLRTTNRSSKQSDVLVFNLIVKPVFYKTWWFTALIILAILGIIGAIFWYRNNEIRKLNRLKKGIADDLHDDLAGTMNTISMISQKLKEDLPENASNSFGLHLGYINTLSEEAYLKIGDIIWSIGGKTHPIHELYDRVLDYIDTYRVYKNCSFIIETALENENILLSAKTNHNLLMIVKEAVHNAFKHTKPHTFKFSIVQQKNSLLIIIINEFDEVIVGIPSNFKGIDSMKRRAVEIQSNLTFEQQSGKYKVSLLLQR